MQFCSNFPATVRYKQMMKHATRKNLRTALSVTIAIVVTVLVFVAVARYAPQDPFVDSGFVKDVGTANRY